MMKNRLLLPVVVALLACGLWAAPTFADPVIGLFDWAFNIDGATSEYSWGNPFPAEADVSGFDDLTGLGKITVTLETPGSHYVGLFVDLEIDEELNTFFNEYGDTSGTPDTGQTWEIDEPGYVFGDIYTNILAGDLDSYNNVPEGLEDDVSMAMAWAFTLSTLPSGEDEWAKVVFELSTTVPSGFYLAHHDPDSDETVYFSSSLTVVPLPGAALLGSLGLGVAGSLMGRFRRRQAQK